MVAAVTFDHVSKRFALQHTRANSFQEILFNFLKRKRRRHHEDFWVLKEVSFQLEAGKTYGFIGANGAGKSTALKLISRIIQPTSGEVRTTGLVSALLELGAGFHPDLTGRENIYLNGAILGLPEYQIRSKVDEITAFAELERFIDVPVKHYSSGMYVRLGFSVAVHTDPEILLVDEVLAVGDAAFQHKCLEKIRIMQRHGMTIVMVSHSMGQIADICDYALWFHEGTVQAFGRPDRVISEYLTETAEVGQEKRNAALLADRSDVPSPEQEKGVEDEDVYRWGNKQVIITGVRLIGPEDRFTDVFEPHHPMRIELDYEVRGELSEVPAFGIGIHRLDGVWCYGTNTALDGIEFSKSDILRSGTVKVALPSLQLLTGDYTLDVAVHNYTGDVMYDYVKGIQHFRVCNLQGDQGVFRPKLHWSLK